MRIYLIPLNKLQAFLKYLSEKGHDIDIIENATLEEEWLNFCDKTQPNPAFKPSWIKRFNPFGKPDETAVL